MKFRKSIMIKEKLEQHDIKIEIILTRIEYL